VLNPIWSFRRLVAQLHG